MLFKSSTAVAILAAASQIVAEPTPYKALKVMSIRDMFGLVGRDNGGYTPTQSSCGLGETCAEACGSGFETCASSDNAIHCYNPAGSQTCCPDNSGNSCDSGYYCTAATNGDTICCPDGQTLEQCAASYGVTGSLVSEIASATSTSSSSSSTSSVSSTLTSSSFSSSSSSSSSSTVTSTSSIVSSSFVAPNTTSFSSTIASSSVSAVPLVSANGTTVLVKSTGYTTTSCSATAQYTAAFGTNNYTSAQVPAAASSTEVAVSSAGEGRPVAAVAALVAAAFAMAL